MRRGILADRLMSPSKTLSRMLLMALKNVLDCASNPLPHQKIQEHYRGTGWVRKFRHMVKILIFLGSIQKNFKTDNNGKFGCDFSAKGAQNGTIKRQEKARFSHLTQGNKRGSRPLFNWAECHIKKRTFHLSELFEPLKKGNKR